MCIELKDGGFTPIEPLSDSLFKKFQEFAADETTAAMHVGVDGLGAKAEEQTPAQSTGLHIPTMDEIKRIMLA